jgi:hypothetical protein
MVLGKHKLILFIGFVVTGVCLWIALRGADWAAIKKALLGANLWLLVPLLGFYFAQLWVKCLRWASLVKPIRQTSSREAAPAVMVGAMVSFLLPTYISEFVRPYLLARQFKLSYASLLATVALERLFDFFTILLLVALVFVTSSKLPEQLSVLGYFIGALSAAIAVVILALVLWRDAFIRLMKLLLAWMPEKILENILKQVHAIADGLGAVKDPRLVLVVAAQSLLQWALMGLSIYMSILAVGIAVPPTAGVVVLALNVAGMSLPSAPGFFGTIQVCFTLGLKAYGVGTDPAFAASVIFHLAVYVFTLLIGFFYLRKLGLGLRQLTSAASKDGEQQIAGEAIESLR